MFERIGKFTSKYRWLVVIVWIVLLVTLAGLAPSLTDVAKSDQGEFLGEDELSVIADEITAQYFPDEAPPSMAVVVVKSKAGSLRDEAPQAYLTELTGWLQHDFAPDLVLSVHSPADPAMADQLISADGHIGMFFIGLDAPYGDRTDQAVEALRTRVEDSPEGLGLYVTGDPAIMYDYHENAMESFESTMSVTFLLVIVTLLIIFRSPVSPLIPLTVVSVAYVIARSLVALLGDAGMDVTTFTDTFLVVIIFGAGTDYCLFLISRFRGFMGEDLPGRAAAQHTIARVGETITASAGTVIVGMLAMSFAEFKFYRNIGPSLGIGVVVGLLAGLTLTPALLALLGRWAFWPRRPSLPKEGGIWGRVSDWVTARPWWRIALAVVLEIPLAIYGLGLTTTTDFLADMPDDMESKAAFGTVAAGFGLGNISPLNIILTDIPDAHSPEGIAYIDATTQELLETEGVADVHSLALPMGRNGPALTEIEQAGLPPGALDYFVASAGEVTRLMVTLVDEPYSDAALETVGRVRDRVGDGGHVQGASATYRDVFDVTEGDMTRITVLVLIGIAIVLVLLMRSLVAPLYMMLTILLSYATTLGLTRLVFVDIADQGVQQFVPLLLFVFLVALGMDYNIFLMGRVKEEVAKHGTKAGIRHALDRTGGIISSAGIIMAGTFGAMMTASIDSLVQMGFTVAVGVLLDTFLIRTTLLPAIAVLLDRWNWWPGKAPTVPSAPPALEPTAAD